MIYFARMDAIDYGMTDREATALINKCIKLGVHTRKHKSHNSFNTYTSYCTLEVIEKIEADMKFDRNKRFIPKWKKFINFLKDIS